MTENQGHAIRRNASLKLGDTVAYSKAFLQSAGQQTGDMPFALGKVIALKQLGETMLAQITWNCDDLPERLNVLNLSRVSDGAAMDS